MGKKTFGVAATPDGSTEVALMHDGWTPIATFRKMGGFAKRVENNASWMLQELLGSGSKVETLYEVCRPDIDAKQAATALGIDVAAMNVVQISGRPQRQSVRAIGVINTNGKRTQMFALIVALGMKEGYGDKFVKELEKYGLDKGLLNLLDQLKKLQNAGSGSVSSRENGNGSWCASNPEMAQAEASGARRNCDRPRERLILKKGPNSQDHFPNNRSERRESRSRSVKRSRSAPRNRNQSSTSQEGGSRKGGIDLKVLRVDSRKGVLDVPVLDVPHDQGYTYENLSWILSYVMAKDDGTDADELLEYIYDLGKHPLLKRVKESCQKQLSHDMRDITIVRVKQLPMREVLAIGTSGQLSCILAAIIGIAVRDAENLEDMRDHLREAHPLLERPFFSLVDRAVDAIDRLGSTTEED